MKTLIFSVSFMVWLCSGTFLYAQTSRVPLTDDPYVKELPTPERVMADMRGTNEIDTAAKQMGAFTQLCGIITTMMGERFKSGEFTPGERQLWWNSYPVARGSVGRKFVWDSQGKVRFPPRSPEGKQWTQSSAYYEESESFRRELLKRYFSPETVARHDELRPAEVARLEVENQQEQARQKELDRVEAVARFKVLVPVGAVIAYSALMAFLLYQVFRGPHQLVAPDFNILQSGRKRYHLHSVTGTVVGEVRKSTEIYTYVSGGYQDRPVSTSHSRVQNLEFLVKGIDGREQPIQTRGGLADFVLREGHVVSAVWAVKEGDSHGSYILFRNHTTKVTNNAGGHVRYLVSNNIWVGVLLAIMLAPTCWGLIVLLVLTTTSVRKRAAFIEKQISDEIIPRLERTAAPLL